MRQKRVTLEEIAQAAGVSRATVSLVVRKSPWLPTTPASGSSGSWPRWTMSATSALRGCATIPAGRWA
ncbi:LacI family DNA-binding transcriptional regulator [Paracoccus aerius]